MKHSKIASVVAGLAMLVFGLASCDIFDPFDPSDPGNGGGGGGRDTIIYCPDDSSNNGGGGWDDPSETFIRAEGTVVWVELEGGFWGIEASNGHEYEPINLPHEFMVNGLKVAFTGTVMNDWVSMHMWGKVLEIGEISKQ